MSGEGPRFRCVDGGRAGPGHCENEGAGPVQRHPADEPEETLSEEHAEALCDIRFALAQTGGDPAATEILRATAGLIVTLAARKKGDGPKDE